MATDVEPLENIESTAKSFISASLGQQSDILISSLDKRLRLAACLVPLNAQWAPGSRRIGRVTVLVSCASNKSWRVHLQGRVTKEQMVWILDRSVRKGEPMTTGDLRQEPVIVGDGRTISRYAAEPISHPDLREGYEFVKSFGAGTLLTEDMLQAPTLVGKGESVKLTFSTDSVQLQTMAVAMSDGSLNERISVKNASTGKTLDALVRAIGVVEAIQ